MIQIPLGLDCGLLAPTENPLTEEKVALGRKLYFDKRLSSDKSLACSDCHQPRNGALRDIKLTAPYMHDGSFKSLEEVLNFYDGGENSNPELDPDIGPLSLIAEEKNALRAFLKTLTGSSLNK